MAENSKIGWTDHTFNSWWGCVKVHRGCKHCYAEDMDNRWTRKGKKPHWGPAPKFLRRMILGEWSEPYRWNEAAKAMDRRARVFCGSMCDFFEDYPDDIMMVDQQDGPICAYGKIMGRLREFPGFEERVLPTMPMQQGCYYWNMRALRWRTFQIIEETPNLEWLLLTKRPWNIREMVPAHWLHDQFKSEKARWPKNVMTGTSPCNQTTAEDSIDHLIGVPGRHFLSIEPQVGPVDLDRWMPDEVSYGQCSACQKWGDVQKILDGDLVVSSECVRCAHGIHWVIAGGESGPEADETRMEHLEQVYTRVVRAGIPMFIKQLGSRPTLAGKPFPITDAKGEVVLDWPERFRIQQFPLQLTE